jgi:hypothetical protein
MAGSVYGQQFPVKSYSAGYYEKKFDRFFFLKKTPQHNLLLKK